MVLSVPLVKVTSGEDSMTAVWGGAVRRSFTGKAALGALAVLLLAACSGAQATQGGGGPGGAVASPSAVAPSSAAPPVVSITPGAGAGSVRPDAAVAVQVQRGALTGVQVRSAKGEQVKGQLDADGGSWHSTGALTVATTYTVTATASGVDGAAPVTKTSTFTTLKPAAYNGARLNVGDDQTVGVGMPIIIRFDRAVRNTDAVLKALTVTTSPQVEGSWHWMEASQWVGRNTEVWFRPKEYWPAGTKVTMTANLGGVELSPGVWGRRTYSTRFTVGDAVIDTVDMAKHTLTMRKNGAAVRTIPVTTGKAGPQWSTRNGIKVISEKAAELRMDSSSIGVKDQADPDFYNEIEHWTMRLTYSGEFLHARPGSEWAFGKQNVSHGCTGMSMADAKWLFDHSRIGDVVVYTGGTRALESGNGLTAWQTSYDKWSA